MQTFSYLYQFGQIALVISMLVYLIVSRKKFISPEQELSKKSKRFLFVSTTLIIISLIGFFSYIYYQSYFPNYEYETVSNQVNFHIYRPSIIPAGRIQSSKFFLKEQKLDSESVQKYPLAPTISVRSVYSYPIYFGDNLHDNPKLIILDQSRVDSLFDIPKYLESSYKDRDLNIQEIQLNSNQFKAAYTEYSEDNIAVQLWLITNDDVLIGLITPKSSNEEASNRMDELIKMAESLE